MKNQKRGEIVLVRYDSALQNSWAVGHMLQTFTDHKGFVWQAQVKTNTNTLLRLITKLCLLLEAEL